MRSLFCGMPVPARYATKSAGRQGGSPESRPSLHRALCLCSSPPLSRPRRKPSANTLSSSIGTTAMSWDFIPGSSCAIGARAKSARPLDSALPGNEKAPISRSLFLGTHSTLRQLQYIPATASRDDHDSSFTRSRIGIQNSSFLGLGGAAPPALR